MADTEHSKCFARKGVRVRAPPSAPRSTASDLRRYRSEAVYLSAEGGSRTRTPFRAKHFECSVSAIPPPRRGCGAQHTGRRSSPLPHRLGMNQVSDELLLWTVNTGVPAEQAAVT